MSTRVLSAVLAATLAISSNLSAAENPKDTAQAADQAQLRKQCEDMKGMDMSKMSTGEHDAMMKKCKDVMAKDKEKPKSDRSY
jgi:hypothetical protein